MNATGKPAVRCLLVRHFVHRFVDNDLLSAHGDRHESLCLAVAAIATTTGSLVLLLSMKYLLAAPRPAQVATLVMEDRFFLLAVAMIVMAVATAVQWNALSLDARDAAILGPLPVQTRHLVLAKSAAVCLYAAGVALMVAVVPSVLHPMAAAANLRPGLGAAVRLISAHFVAAVVASLCAFLAVLVVRELLRLLLGERAFASVSAFAQSTLLVVLTTLLLLLVGGRAGAATALVDGTGSLAASRLTLPAVWFLGLAESLTGDAIVGDARSVGADDDFLMREIRRRQPRFREHAIDGLGALGALALVAAAAYAWNSRRLPQPLARRAGRRRVGEWFERFAARVIVQNPMSRAGFGLTVRVLVRSAPHRGALSVAFAVALALAAETCRKFMPRERSGFVESKSQRGQPFTKPEGHIRTVIARRAGQPCVARVRFSPFSSRSLTPRANAAEMITMNPKTARHLKRSATPATSRPATSGRGGSR